MSGFPAVSENQIPWFSHDFPLSFHVFSMINATQKWWLVVYHFTFLTVAFYPFLSHLPHKIWNKHQFHYHHRNVGVHRKIFFDNARAVKKRIPWFFHRGILKFHDFSMILAFFSNSMIFPGLENAFFIFQVFHDFPWCWEPWLCKHKWSNLMEWTVVLSNNQPMI